MPKIRFLLALLFCIFPSLVFAGKSYYVDCSSNFNGDGSFSKPWNNIESVNNKMFARGDDVYFKVDTTCTATAELRVDWEGTSDDRIIIGAYYDNVQFGLGGHNRPTIDGDGWTIPRDKQGLIEIFGDAVDYVTVQDLLIKHSNGVGIWINYSDHITVDNCYVYRSKNAGIAFFRSTDGIISNNTIEESSYLTKPAPGILLSGMSEIGSTTRCAVRNNKVFHAYEGIGLFKGVNNTTVEYNVVYDCRSYMLYVENSTHIFIRYNLIYSSSEWSKWHTGNHPTSAIVLNAEQGRCDDLPDVYPYIGYCEIYGNLIAWTYSGIALADQCNGSAHVGNKIYHNTIVDCVNNFRFGTNKGWAENEIKNNISWTISSDSSHIYNNDYNREGIIWSHNNFNSPISGNAANNAIIGDPLLIKTSGWRVIAPGSATGIEWSLQEKSPAKNKGLFIKGFAGQIYGIDLNAKKIRLKVAPDPTPDIGAWSASANSISMSAPRNLKISVKSK